MEGGAWDAHPLVVERKMLQEKESKYENKSMAQREIGGILQEIRKRG